jgi:uncharacterized protein YqeY
MALKEQINNDLKTALLSGNRFAGEVLRGLKATILDEEISQKKRDEGLNDEAIEQLVAREIKKRNESAVIYDGANRPELASDERAEAKVLSAYLPEQLSEDDVLVIVKRVISDMGVTSPSAMGQVIGAVKKKLGNTADGATIAKLVKNALN